MNTYLQVMDSQIIEYIQSEYDKFYQAHRGGPWNGKQIRNAVQIAACLAFFEHKDGAKNLPAVLTAEHFRTVHATMTEFDMYMTKAQRADNSKMAHMAGDRFDGYGKEVESHEPVEFEGFSDFMPVVNIRFLCVQLDVGQHRLIRELGLLRVRSFVKTIQTLVHRVEGIQMHHMPLVEDMFHTARPPHTWKKRKKRSTKTPLAGNQSHSFPEK